MIVADDLGFSGAGCYEEKLTHTHADKLTVGDVRLAQFYTTGRYCPLLASILTGQSPNSRVGVYLTT